MEIRIGVIYTARELVVEMEDGDEASVQATVDAAVSASSVLWLTDKKGRQIGVPTDKIAFVEVIADQSDRQVGFGKR